MASPFERVSNADLKDLIEAYPLAWVISQGPAGFAATALPLLAETNYAGELVRLIGHFARSNPQVAALELAPRALFLFQGPQGYISPSWLSNRRWAPTWNYAVIHIEAEVRFLPDQADVVLDRLVHHMEDGRPNAWSSADMGERYLKLRPGIIAFHAEILSVQPRFKLGQDEQPEVLAEILQGNSDEALNAWMRRMNRRET